MTYMLRLSGLLALLALFIGTGCSVTLGDSQPANMQRLDERLQFGFVKGGYVYCVHRKIEGGKLGSLTLVFPRFSKLALLNKDQPTKQLGWVELDDQFAIANAQNFIRWRLASRNIWGTERILDDQGTSIFHVPTKDIDQLKEDEKKTLTQKGLSPEDRVQFEKKYYHYGVSDLLIKGLAYWYWDKKGVGISATAIGPWDEGWPKGSSGIYFDFLPTKDEKSILLFVLFEKQYISLDLSEKGGIWHSGREEKLNVIRKPLGGAKEQEKSCYRRNIIKVWLCKQKDHSSLIRKQLIDTDIKEPFYVFEMNGDYYFATLSGKIYVAPHASVDPQKLDRLIAELDSDTFSNREKASRDLRNIGKPAQQSLEAHLSKSTSLEQKRRITQILDELKLLSDRETKLLWKDEKRPVDKLLFDQDKDKIYAFTKPNRDKQVYFFEIADKPQPRLFTGNTAPDAPASLPASTRLFLEYARFVRKLK